MGHVYRERCEIRRPAFALLNHCDGRVYVINGGNLNDRTTIGWATNDEYFHPNDSFRLLYPDEWEAAFHKYNDPKCYELKVGMYGLALSVGYSSGLYPVLVQAYDGLYADDIMDYAMYSILQRSDVSQLYSERMRDEVLFSETVHSDSYWSTLFKDKLTESQHFTFRELWLKARIAKGVRRVWICIDGSNNDCQVKDSDLSECGEGKSHSGKPIVGFIYAVDAETGEPITYFVNPGGTVDSQALHEISNFLVGYNLEVEGVILDKGFCTFEDLMTIKGLGSKYIIMVPAGTKGHKTMVDLFGQRIFWNSEYVVDHVRTKSVFGICGEVEIWSSHPGVTGFLNLYFGGIRGAFESGRELEEVFEAKEHAEEVCAQGKKPTIDKKYKKIILVNETDDGYEIICDFNEWNRLLRSQGFFTILSSDNFGPKFVYDSYKLRMVSETDYRLLKSQEGFDTARVHTDPSIQSKYAIGFASLILRHWIMKACQRHTLDTNVMIQQMDRIRFLVNDGGKVVFIRDISGDALDLFSEFSMNKESFESLAEEYNTRAISRIKSEIRVRPDIKTESYEKPRRGRPLGSKNKKTLEKEAEQKSLGRVFGESRKRGRPFGTKDSKPRKKRSDAGVPRGPRQKR